MTVMSPPLTPFKDAHPETWEAYLMRASGSAIRQTRVW